MNRAPDVATTAKHAPLSFSQERLWFLEQLDPGTPAYHIPRAWRVHGALIPRALREAWRALCLRHTILRTVYGVADGMPHVRVLDEGPEIVEADWSAIPSQEHARTLEEYVCRPFDLSAEPPLRCLLAHLTDQEHLLLIVVHHIAFDGWSGSVFYPELGALYNAFANGSAAELAQPAMQYSDYATRQRANLTPEVLDRLAQPWIDRLTGVPVLRLPSCEPPAAIRNSSGAHYLFSLPRSIAAEVHSFARARRITDFSVYLAAFQALLARYSGQTDFCIGTPYANRDDDDLEGVIGFFVNTLVLRAALSGDPSFAQIVQRAGATVLDAISDAQMPFERLVERMQPERSRGQTPFFQVLFAYQSFPASELSLTGLEAEPLEVATPTSLVDLGLSLTPGPEGIACRLRYSPSLFDARMAERFAEHYRNLLETAIRQPDLPLSRLEYLSAGERSSLLAAGQGPCREYPQIPIHRVFEEQAARRPDHPAIISGDNSISYSELNARANRLARLLLSRGLSPGGYAAVLISRSTDLIVAWLAVLKAGCAYLPLDPADPPNRLAAQLQDCGASAVISHSAPPSALSGAVPLSVDLLAERDALSGLSPANLDISASIAQPACVMFSSGSTGRPKGAAITHRAILRLLFNNGYADFLETDTFLFMAPPSFDASTLEVWGPLLHGASCAVLPAGVPSLSSIDGAIAKHRVSVMWLTSSLFNTFIDEMPGALRPLRLLMTGGEALSVPHVRAALRLLPQTCLLNGYGPTENTTFTSCWEIPRDFPESAQNVPIGSPIAHTSTYVLDPAGQLVPIGVPGELHAGGDGVALGYLGLPELSADRFVPDPFARSAGARMYRTGDIVRWLEGGILEYLGRTDDQVKIRGFRIEPGEIESVLASHPEVRDAAVIVREAGGEKALIAYFTLHGNPAGPEPDLRDYLSSRLPPFMLPRHLIRLQRFTLLPTGKIDRAALPSPEMHHANGAAEAPRPGMEERIAALWRRLLRVSSVSRTDNFFDLGGHSLAAVRLVALIEKELGVRIPVGDLFASPVLAELAAALSNSAQPERKLAPLQPHGTLPAILSLSGGPRFRNLALHIDPARPVHFVPDPETSDLRHPCRCEDIAARYADWLLSRSPEGPWILTGWCLAGVIAFETARLLSAKGPGAVILVESPCPVLNGSRSAMQNLRRALGRTAYHARVILQGRHGGLSSYLSERVQTMREQRALIEFGRRYRAQVDSGAQPDAPHDFQLLLNHAASQYAPPAPLDWPVLLVRANERAADRIQNPDWGWSTWAPSLQVAWVDGDHGSIFEDPHVTETARHIREWLNRVPSAT